MHSWEKEQLRGGAALHVGCIVPSIYNLISFRIPRDSCTAMNPLDTPHDNGENDPEKDVAYKVQYTLFVFFLFVPSALGPNDENVLNFCAKTKLNWVSLE